MAWTATMNAALLSSVPFLESHPRYYVKESRLSIMYKNTLVLLLVLIMSFCTGCSNEGLKPNRSYEYLGQPYPGLEPVPFSPDFLPKNVRDAAFTPDGQEFYFTHIQDKTYRIMQSQYESGKWTVPSVAPFSGSYNDFEPFVSADGKKLYFASMRPSEGKEDMQKDIDIWVMERTDKGWGDPTILGITINSRCMEYYPSVTRDGTIYFGRNDLELTRGDIYCSRYVDGKYLSPVKLPGNVNLPNSSFNAYISADESYVIFSAYLQEGQAFHSDLFISFRDINGGWSESRNLGERINTKANELSPWVSHDGKYIFFSSTRLDATGENKIHDIFWVSAEIIKEHKLEY